MPVLASPRSGRRLAALSLIALLGGCSFAGDATTDTAGIGAGALAGGLTANPFIGLAVGVAARWASGAVVNAVERDIQRRIQERIAEVGGAAEPTVAMPWAVSQTLPGGDEAGVLIVTREFGAPLIPCRELVFSVLDGGDANFYVGTICQSPAGEWKWAVAEPATSRWGSLQ